MLLTILYLGGFRTLHTAHLVGFNDGNVPTDETNLTIPLQPLAIGNLAWIGDTQNLGQSAQPLMQNPTGYILLFLVFSFFVVLFFYWRSVRLREQKMRLEREVKLRTSLLLEQSRELKEEKEKYKRANEIKTRLLRFAAHDLRNPITAIMGYSRMLQLELEDASANEYATVIHEISEKMYHIVQNMLASGARDEESLQLEFEPVSVKKLINALQKQYHFFLLEKKQALNIKIDDDIPDIYADRVRILEVLENLLSNAIKYSPVGSEIEIGTELKKDPRDNKTKVVISITDMGPGFSDDDLNRAFGEFQKLSAKPTGDEISTGLGLFIVKQLVAAHEGRISINNNNSGIGSTISISIPAICQPECEEKNLLFEKS